MAESLDNMLARLERAPWSCGVAEGLILVAEVRRLRERVAVFDRDGGQTDTVIRMSARRADEQEK